MQPPKFLEELEEREEPRLRILKKGHILLNPQEKIVHIWFLKKGFIRQYVVSSTGEEVTIHIFRPGALFPLMLHLADLPNRFYFQASTNIEMQEYSASGVSGLIKDNPKLLLDLSRKFATAINALSFRIEILATKNSRIKLLLFLEYLANQFASKKVGVTKIEIPFTHTEIAAWIGVKRETASREISNLAKSKVITVKQGFFTINRNKLLKMTEEN